MLRIEGRYLIVDGAAVAPRLFGDSMILIRQRPDGLVGVATPPHSKSTWVFADPITEEAYVQRMVEEGCHSTDMWDALSEAQRNGFGYL